MEAISKLIKSELYEDAKKLIKQIIENCPYDYRGLVANGTIRI